MKKAWLMLGLLMCSSVILVAQDDRGDGRDNGRSPVRIVAGYFELDEAQVEVFQGLMATRHDTVELLSQQARELGAALREAINAPEPDPYTIGELVLAEKDIRVQIQEAQEGFGQGFQDMLTEEQMGRYNALLRARRLAPVLRAVGDIKLQLLPMQDGEE